MIDPFCVVCRPVVSYREEDWEKKEVYVDSVTRHITDNVKDGKHFIWIDSLLKTNFAIQLMVAQSEIRTFVAIYFISD